MFRYKFNILTICIVAIMVLYYGISFAQTLTTNEPAGQKTWEILLKVLFPAIWTIAAPWITGRITVGISYVPPTLRVAISSLVGALAAGLAGTVPDFPLTVESAATMGLGSGAMGQMISNMQPETMKPKTVAAQATIDATQAGIDASKKAA